MLLRAFICSILAAVALGNNDPTRRKFSESFLVNDLTELPFDENGRLVDNWLLYLDNKECKALTERVWVKDRPAYRRIASMSQGVSDKFFEGESNNNNYCNVVTIPRGTSRNLISYALPLDKLSLSAKDDMDTFASFLADRQRAEVGFVSHSKRPNLTIYWLNPTDGSRMSVGALVYGEKHTIWQVSHLGHQFILVDDKSGDIIEQYTIKHHSFFVYGEGGSATRKMDVTRQIEETLRNEYYRSRNVKRTFTEVGFARDKLPRDLFSSMQSYYYNNRNNSLREEWDTKGLYVNWWESDVYMVAMPWGLKRYWQSRLKDLVEAWAGEELELTDIYGMRRYEDGARLLTHVDREATHAASLIINIAQGDIREPWMVEIYDHADRLHEVPMEEGDIVYYESARSLHGRMKPLQGAYYVNLFSHYRPVGDPDWFRKENGPERVKPLIDLGKCTYKTNATVCEKGHVPYLSPSEEAIKDPGDLFKYWKKVSPTGGKDEL